MSEIRELLLGIRSLQLQMKRLICLATKDEMLSQGLIFLLFRLSQVGALKMTEISEHFGLSAGAATGMADKLEQQGLVKRVRSTEDRRIVQVVLTEEGEKRLEQIKREFERLAGQALAGIPKERLAEMIATIREITDTMETHLGGEKHDRC
ncbi:MAG: MarR family transcriptional regulator [Brevibacillus sp.]|nr:MarR family transcriptional regulator [Brevibacillus sp.]